MSTRRMTNHKSIRKISARHWAHSIAVLSCALMVCLDTAVFAHANAATTSARPKPASAATFVVAASNSRDKSGADYVCDGVGDQAEIQAAIDALPADGGSVLLLEGTYDIRKVGKEGIPSLGGILITRSNVCLKGSGWGTKLILADNQSVNVMRVIGENIGKIIIRDLYIDVNRANNPRLKPPFESCGIRAGLSNLKLPGGPFTSHDVMVDSCYVINAPYLDIMLWGKNMVVTNNYVADSGSDGIEVLGGPARISNNYVEVTRNMGGGIGTDNANDVIISNNHIICNGGSLGIGIYIWAGTYRSILIGNEIVCHSGKINIGLDIRGNQVVLVGNTVANVTQNFLTGTKNTGQGCIVYGNIFANAGDIKINSLREEQWPILLRDNHLYDTSVTVGSGNVIMYEQRTDLFMDCLAASTGHVGSWAGTGAEQEITVGITHPDVPRNLSVSCSNNAAPSGHVTVHGTDARGNAISEIFTVSPGGTVYGKKAFSKITKITIPAGVKPADKLSMGISDKLGLSNVICDARDVYKVKKNNADAAIGTVDANNGTVDCATIAAGDDFTIYYRLNLNSMIKKPPPLVGSNGIRLRPQCFIGGMLYPEYAHGGTAPKDGISIEPNQAIRAVFELKEDQIPINQGKSLILSIDGLDCEKPGTAEIEILLNKHRIFEGMHKCAKERWSVWNIPFDKAWLCTGVNTLEFQNLEKSAPKWHKWFMIACVKIGTETDDKD